MCRVSYLHSYPLICPEKSIVCRWRIACCRYNWYFNKMVVFVRISTTESSPDQRNYLVLSDIFLQNWEDDCDLRMIRFGWLDSGAGYQFSLISEGLSRQTLSSIQVWKLRKKTKQKLTSVAKYQILKRPISNHTW